MTVARFVLGVVCVSLLGCSAPQAPEDGKPVAISPMGGTSTERLHQSTPTPEKTATPEPSKLTLADFEQGKWNGLYVQDRCTEGLRESTRITAAEVVRKTELFETGLTSCDETKRVRTTEITQTLVAVQGDKVDLQQVREVVTLHRDSDVQKANEKDAAEPPPAGCLEVWELNKPHGANLPSECAMARKEFTLLAVESTQLRWGAPSQELKSGALLDASTEAKRHTTLEQLPYIKIP